MVERTNEVGSLGRLTEANSCGSVMLLMIGPRNHQSQPTLKVLWGCSLVFSLIINLQFAFQALGTQRVVLIEYLKTTERLKVEKDGSRAETLSIRLAVLSVPGQIMQSPR